MKSKIFSLFALSILAVLVLVGFASAQIALSATDTEFTQVTGNTLTVNVTGINSSSNNVTFSFSTVEDVNENEITFTVSPTSLNIDGSVIITATIPSDFDFFGKKYFTTLTATEKNGSEVVSTDTEELSFAQSTDFCYFDDNEFEEDSNLVVEVEETNVIEGLGEDEDWYSFDEVEVEVSVKAKTEDVNDISLEWGLFDKKSGEWVIEMDEEDEFDLEEGDKETFTIKFKLDDSLDIDLDEIGEDLVFYVRATGEGDETDDFICASDSEEANFNSVSKFVLIDNIEITGSVSCGDEIQITANVWNIGSSDQEDVYVDVYNSELGINERVEIGDIDPHDSEKLSLTITLPDDADEKNYALNFLVYNNKGKLFEHGDAESKFSYVFSIEAGSCSLSSIASIDASLESEARAGQELIVKAIITNTGSKTKTFSVSASGYSEWASSASLDEESLVLKAGESAEVMITLDVMKGISGDQQFDIEVVEGSRFMSQPVMVSVEEGSFFSFLTGAFAGSGNNTYLWVIGALNVVLVIAIVAVAARIAKKKPVAETEDFK